MKKLYIYLSFSFLSLASVAQNFTWVKGSSTAGPTGVYGTQNVAASANTPGQRHGCAKWVDASGNLWLFGGEGPTSSWWNDLWKYNIATNQWTWVRGATVPNSGGVYGTMGTPSSTNEPGAREFPVSWTDASGNFWMFGGDGYDASSTWGRLGDLWKYDPTTNQWTWIKGYNLINQIGVYGTQGSPALSNVPGGRARSIGWTDPAGDLWLFGGVGYGSGSLQGYLNDLLKYNIASNQWTWISGSNTNNQAGAYGTQGVPSTANHPGGRFFPSWWQDASGNTFLFGGFGYSATTANYLNDFWKYDPVSNTWAWISGSNAVDALGVYGAQGLSAPTNMPGSRHSSAYWKDAGGNFWIFGGHGFSSAGAHNELNDLFRYNPTMNQWTWVKGSNISNQNGTYGTQGVAAASNMPGAREFNTCWKDLTGKFWLFGGEGYDISSTATNHMNDLWSYSVPCSPDSITVLPGKFLCSGASPTLTAVNGGASTVWYPTAVSTSSISGGATLTLPSLTVAGTQTVYSYFAEANYCTSAPRASVNITVNALPSLTVTASRTITCKGQPPVIFTATGASSYTWHIIPQQTTSTLSVQPPNITTTYSVSGTDINGCSASSTITLKIVTDCLGISEIALDHFLYSLYPNPSKGEFVLKVETEFENGQIDLVNALGQKVFEQRLNASEIHVKQELPSGVYFYRVTLNGNKSVTGKLIIE